MLILPTLQKIAKTKSLSVRSIDYPNPVLNVGIFEENMGPLPQVAFMKLKLPQVDNNSTVDTSYNGETGKGSIYIPEYKDFYTGEPTTE
jgi:hypothetical protein